jgi:hypothetical protein
MRDICLKAGALKNLIKVLGSFNLFYKLKFNPFSCSLTSGMNESIVRRIQDWAVESDSNCNMGVVQLVSWKAPTCSQDCSFFFLKNFLQYFHREPIIQTLLTCGVCFPRFNQRFQLLPN